MSDLQTFLPPPHGVEMITAWDDCNGEWHAERLPLVCIKAIHNSEVDSFDAMSVDGDCLNDSSFQLPARALLLADGRVVIPQSITFKDIDDWLAYIKEEKSKTAGQEYPAVN